MRTRHEDMADEAGDRDAIVRISREHHHYGYRKIAAVMRYDGWEVTDRVVRYWRRVYGIRAQGR